MIQFQIETLHTKVTQTGLLLENRKRTESKFQVLTEEKHNEISDGLELSP
jgi:hypothetical protein